jgi:hypothetical protein
MFYQINTSSTNQTKHLKSIVYHKKLGDIKMSLLIRSYLTIYLGRLFEQVLPLLYQLNG